MPTVRHTTTRTNVLTIGRVTLTPAHTWPELVFTWAIVHCRLRTVGVESHLVEQRVAVDPPRPCDVEVVDCIVFFVAAETSRQTNFSAVFLQWVVRGTVFLTWRETQKSHMV